eukprot:2492215-Rhodomonas_salina.1
MGAPAGLRLSYDHVLAILLRGLGVFLVFSCCVAGAAIVLLGDNSESVHSQRGSVWGATVLVNIC